MQVINHLRESKSHPHSRRHKGALNFEEFAAQGNCFVNQVARELGTTRNSAARITKAVLHAVRDRLPPIDAVQFAQGLPMALKAVYFDQYDLSVVPVVMRRPHDFLDYIYYKNEFTAYIDFPFDHSEQDALRAVFRVLEWHMDHGQIGQIKKIMGGAIAQLIDERFPERRKLIM